MDDHFERQDDDVTARLNAIYDEETNALDPVLARLQARVLARAERNDMDTTGWETFSHTRFPLRFLYPDPTPNGSAVRTTEGEVPDGYRVHLAAEDPDELYFEVLTSARTPEAEYQRLREILSRQFREVDLSPLVRGERASRPAWETSFRFRGPDGGQERRVVYFRVGETTCRILFRPLSALNAAVLDTLTFP